MDMFDKALKMATEAHAGQYRKISEHEMILHPISVSKTLSDAGFPIEVVIAGLLHDTVEDTYITLDDIANEFGPVVAGIVHSNTENKLAPWMERKQTTINQIKSSSLPVKALIVADKLDNLRSLVMNHETLGDKIWEKFNKGYDLQKWYFTSVCENAFVGLKEEDIPTFFFDYKDLVDNFFQ